MKKILGYADCWSLTPGATVRFKVSTYGPSRYRADLVRVICGDNEPEHGVFHEEEMDAPFNGDYDGRFQPIDAGSYAVVEGSTALQALESFTLQAWILPTTPNKGEQGLITHWRDDPAAGFALVIDENGALAFRVADGNGTTDVATGKPLVERRRRGDPGVASPLTGDAGEPATGKRQQILRGIRKRGRAAPLRRVSGPAFQWKARIAVSFQW
jgi:N,N-dimethylformamidase